MYSYYVYCVVHYPAIIINRDIFYKISYMYDINIPGALAFSLVSSLLQPNISINHDYNTMQSDSVGTILCVEC